MDAMQILGYVLAMLVGISLGLIGGGGSILAVPIMNMVMGIPVEETTAYSLFVVGTTSLVGGIKYFKAGLFDKEAAVIFGIPSILAVFFSRYTLVPAIPEEISWLGNMPKGTAILLLFSIIMVTASIKMILSGRKKGPSKTMESNVSLYKDPKRLLIVAAEGVVVGTITGIVGAGGGFLIIPALVLITGLEMKTAVGTSLIIITVKSLVGFTGDLMNPNMNIDWMLLLIFSTMSVVGIFVGFSLSKKISGAKLKPAFGWFLLICGTYIALSRMLA